jgi:hypothetical protein
MGNIAIKGHPTRGKEVIEILEMLGAKNKYNLSGDGTNAYYVIELNEIKCGAVFFGDTFFNNFKELFESCKAFL